jgi:hypothetical protein
MNDSQKAQKAMAVANVVQSASCLGIMIVVLVPILACLAIFLFSSIFS